MFGAEGIIWSPGEACQGTRLTVLKVKVGFPSTSAPSVLLWSQLLVCPGCFPRWLVCFATELVFQLQPLHH